MLSLGDADRIFQEEQNFRQTILLKIGFGNSLTIWD